MGPGVLFIFLHLRVAGNGVLTSHLVPVCAWFMLGSRSSCALVCSLMLSSLSVRAWLALRRRSDSAWEARAWFVPGSGPGLCLCESLHTGPLKRLSVQGATSGIQMPPTPYPEPNPPTPPTPTHTHPPPPTPPPHPTPPHPTPPHPTLPWMVSGWVKEML